MILTNTRLALVVAAIGLLSACGGANKHANKLFYEDAAYNEAADAYKGLLTKGGSNLAELNAQIGESYRLSNRPGLALPYYKAALEAGNKTDSIKYNAALAAKDAGNLTEAKALFADYSNAGRKQKWVERAKLEMANIDKLPALAKLGSEYEVENVSALNTPSAEYGPLLVSNNEELAFTATRSGAVYKGNGLPFSDVYHVKLTDLAGATPTLNPYTKFNTSDRHEASVTFSADGKTAVFARSNDGSRKGGTDIDLYQSTQNKDGNWSEPELLSISSASAWDACPAFSKDGKSLYFASNREGGKGGIDLYRATQDPKGAWTKVTNLGAEINTPGDEMFPSASDDGKLYFSSDGQAGFGGQDLFVATRDRDKGTTVENLGQPVNSKADDFGITLKNAYEGYFTSNREGGKGDDDIYYFRNTLLEPKIIRLTIAGLVQGVSDGKPEGILADAKVRLLEGEQPAGETVTDASGKFSLPVGEDKNYTVLIEKDGYFTKRDAFSTFGKLPPRRQLKKENDIALPYEAGLDKIKIQAAIVVENIYYDLNRANIRTDAAAELDKIVTMLNDNPNITIELSSHTDSRGDDKLNQRLSQLRADSATLYIESKGIADNRIAGKGYGKTRPIIANATTEDEHQKNRRTEFKVTKIEGQIPAKPKSEGKKTKKAKGKK